MMDMSVHIRESNLIEGIDDPAEDAQALEAWRFLEKQTELTHRIICEVQRLITKNQYLKRGAKGYYRSHTRTTVRVGDSVYGWAYVDGMMENWLLDYWWLDPMKAHIRFEHIHPFVDGNGRTGRMLMWWHEIKLGREPTLIRSNEADRFEYYQRFRMEG